MPGPEQVVKAFVTLPFTVARRVAGLLGGLLPGGDDTPDRPARPDPQARAAATEALAREREPVEEAIFTPDDDFFEDDHVESEVELVAESADVGATEPPGPQLHVDEPWDGYRRMKVAEIATRLEGQPPEVLAAVELYETTHRNRQGVLEAVKAASRA